MCAVENKRGCGYRKVGGTYLVSEGETASCDRLPIALDVCPVCSHGFKQARGWTWVDLFGLVGGNHADEGNEADCVCEYYCPLCRHVKKVGKAGLLWIGEKFYKTPLEFMREGKSMGFSRRIKALPRGFKVGETWVLLAHPKVIRTTEVIEGELIEQREKWLPGIFTLWLPSRIERIMKESERDGEEAKKLIEQGITIVYVPDNDPDHQGSVYDKPEDEDLLHEEEKQLVN